MYSSDFTILRTSDPDVIDAFTNFFARVNEYSAAIKDFVLDVNLAFPLADGVRVPMMVDSVLVGISSPTEPLADMEGWEPSFTIGAWVPDASTPAGLFWAKRLDDIPVVPDDLTERELRSPLALSASDPSGQVGSLHASFVPSAGFEEPCLYSIWGARLTPEVLWTVLAATGGEDIWFDVPRSEWFERVELMELMDMLGGDPYDADA
jgi:hypothetical protein